MTRAPRGVDRARVRWHAVFPSLPWLVLAAGCGGAAPAPEAPPPPAQTPGPAHAPISDLDALEHDLDVANDRLTAGLERKQRDLTSSKDEERGGEEAEKTPAEKSADKKTRPAKPKPGDALDRDQAGPSGGDSDTRTTTESSLGIGSPCDIACRALASMKRSADKICELAGEQSERCSRARAKVVDAESRLKNAGCACRQGETNPPPLNDARNEADFPSVCTLTPTKR